MPCREQFIAVILNTCYKYLNWPNPGGSLPMAWKREGKASKTICTASETGRGMFYLNRP